MFARRRSSLSLNRLAYLNIALLTCCLFVIGPVSSMSLDRLGRQFQQQNDKQLEFSESILPEAESEMLQSDMELVPALDGNSDMYLLVPAANDGQEENLQTLSESNKVQNADNAESNSDMLMMESEDTPAMQILELPDYAMATKVGEEVAINNKLNQHLANKDQKQTFNDSEEISDSMMNTIAEAAQEIKNEIETELEDSDETFKNEELAAAENAKQDEEISASNEFPLENKDSEKENADTSAQDLENLEEEMIGVVMEESNETSAASLEIENSQETEKHDEDLQAEESKQSQEQSIEESASKENQSDENSSNQTVERENADVEQQKAETESDQGEELENSIANKKQKNATNIEVQDVDEMESLAADNIQSETQEVEKYLAEEESPTVQDTHDDYKMPSVEESQIDEEIKPSVEETLAASDDTEASYELLQAEETIADGNDEEIQAEKSAASVEMQIAAEGHESEEANDKTQTISMTPQVTENVALKKAESLEETQDLADLQRDEEKIENLEEFGHAVMADEKQSDHETQSDDKIQSVETDPNSINFVQLEEFDKIEPAQLIAESQIVEEFPKADEASQVSDSDVVDETKQEQLDKIKLDNEEEFTSEDLQGQDVQTDEEIQQAMEISLADQIQDFEDNISNIKNTETQGEEAEPMHKTEQDPENTLNVEETQYVEESLNLDNVPNIEEAQMAEEPVEHLQNLQTAEEVSYDKEIAAVAEAQSAEVAHVQAVEEAHEQFQTVEAHNTLDETPTIENSQSVNMSQSAEESQNNEDAEYIQTADVQHPAEEEAKLTEENPTKVEDYETNAVDVKPVASAADIKSTKVSQPSLEFHVEQQESRPVDAKPEDIPVDEILAMESYKPDNKEIANQSVVLTDENTLNIKDNKNENLQKETAEIQKPFKDISKNTTTERESTTMLTTILQAPTNDELTQQQVQNEKLQVQEEEQQQQPALVEIVSSTTLKPFNVLDSVLNYVNASFMNQMSNDNNNNNNKINEVKDNKKVFNSKLRRYDGAQVWRIVVQNEKERKLADELQTKFDGQLWKEVKQEVDYLLKPQVLDDAEHHVRAANLTRIILIDNLQKVIEVENPPAEEIAQLQNRNGCRLTWQAYHRLDDIHAYFDYLAKTYPDICSVETIGYSLEKRPLKILKISNGNAQNPGIWIDGGMHAREWVSPAVVTYIANQIVEGWDDLPDYMRNINWYIHAVANPDGYEYSHTTDRLWRKNKRSHGRACPGVDLNRNFGYKWGGKGTSANPCAQTYRGVKAFSEPETFYISKFISNFPRETFKAYLSFHSYGQYILYPWGYDSHITKDMADLDLVARQAGTIITKSTGAKFTVGSSATTLYPAAGGSDDWAKGIAGIKYSYTIEMGDTGRYGFILPASHIVTNGKNGLTFVETVAKAVTLGKSGRRLRLKAFRTH